jgi:hypothetical protein
LLKEVVELQADQATEDRPEQNADAQLREHLQRRWVWSAEDIDGQLELGWTLRDLVELSKRDFDPEWYMDVVEDQREEALFPA